MSKPREFWLGLNEKVIYTKDDFIRGEPKEDFPFVRVIEKKAYDDAIKTLEEMAEALDRYTCVDDSHYANETLDRYRKFKEGLK